MNSSPPYRPIRSVSAEVVADGLGDAAQHDVAGRVAVGVVDRLEVVDVDEGDRERPLIAAARSTSVNSAPRSAWRLETPVSLSVVADSWVSRSADAIAPRAVASRPPKPRPLPCTLVWRSPAASRSAALTRLEKRQPKANDANAMPSDSATPPTATATSVRRAASSTTGASVPNATAVTSPIAAGTTTRTPVSRNTSRTVTGGGVGSGAVGGTGSPLPWVPSTLAATGADGAPIRAGALPDKRQRSDGG